MRGYLVLIILVLSLLIAGCTTQSVGQNNVSQPNEPSVSKSIDLTQTPLVSENQPKDITYTDDNVRWPLYKDSFDRFQIYYPNNWILVPVDSPYIEPNTDIYGTTEQMHKEVWIYPPTKEGDHLTSGNGTILISGYTISNPNKTLTSKQHNDISYASFSNRVKNYNKATNVQTENTDYFINGNPTRHFTYDDLDGRSTHDVYLITHNYSFYTIQWAGNKIYVDTASKIMRTFDPY